jgi:predicted secreted protein
MKKAKLFILGLVIVAMSACGNSTSSKSATIDLPYNAGTGYEWFFDISEAGIVSVSPTDSSSSDDSNQVAGGSKIATYEITGARQGEVTVNFKLIRPWEKNPKPAETKTVKVTVDSDLKTTITN